MLGPLFPEDIPGEKRRQTSDTGVYTDNAVEFTANDKAILTSTGSAWEVGATDFSFDFWVYRQTTGTQCVFNMGLDADNRITALFGAGNKLVVEGYAATTLVISMGSTAVPAVGTWNNYAIVCDRDSAAGCQIYYNGVSSLVGTPTSSTLPSSVIGKFELGHLNGLAYFNGRLDSFGFWNTALSSTLVASLFGASLGKNYADLSTAEKTNLVAWHNFSESGGTRTPANGTNAVLVQSFTQAIGYTPALLNGDFETSGTNGGLATNTTTYSRQRGSSLAEIVTIQPHGLSSGNIATTTGFAAGSSWNVTNFTVIGSSEYSFTFESPLGDEGLTLDSSGRVSTDTLLNWSEFRSGDHRIIKNMAAADTDMGSTFCAEMEVAGTGLSTSLLSLVQLSRFATYHSYDLVFKAKSSTGTPFIRCDSLGSSLGVTLSTSWATYAISFTAISTDLYISPTDGSSYSVYIDNLQLMAKQLDRVSGIPRSLAVNADTVGFWDDTVGAYDAVQTVFARRPVFMTGGLNGKSYVKSDGIDDFLQITGDSIGTGDITQFWVIKLNGWGPSGAGRMIENGYFRIITNAGGFLQITNNGTTNASTSAASVALSTPYIISITRRSTGQISVWINGVNKMNEASGGTPTGSPSITYLFNTTTGVRSLDADVYEAFTAYNNILSDIDRKRIEDYYSKYYGIAVQP
jgi:hypothetical protein